MKRAALEQISSVPLKRPPVLSPNRRFLPPITREEATEKAKGAVPANTKLAKKWALRTFESWVSFRNSMSEEKVPEDLLACNNSEVVCYWLCRFVSEARKENGEPYPPATIRSLLAAYQRILQENKLDYHLFSKNDFRFRDLQNTIDSVCVNLRKEGVGAIRKAAAVITKEDEQLLWSSGVMGTDSPWPLLRAVFYTVGLSFTLRGGQEHRDLTIDQFRRFPQDHGVYDEDTYYQYVEHGSKNYQGRLSDLDSNKVSYIYAQPDYSIPGMCPVQLIDLYISKLPKNPKAFYMQPMQRIDSDPTRPWYQVTPVGVNTLKNMMAKMSELAGLSNRYTNHSLRATACTRMFNAGIPEKIIAEFSGHRSSKGLQKYEHTSTKLIKEAGLAIKDEKIQVKEENSSGEKEDKIKKLDALQTWNFQNCTIKIQL